MKILLKCNSGWLWGREGFDREGIRIGFFDVVFLLIIER